MWPDKETTQNLGISWSDAQPLRLFTRGMASGVHKVLQGQPQTDRLLKVRTRNEHSRNQQWPLGRVLSRARELRGSAPALEKPMRTDEGAAAIPA